MGEVLKIRFRSTIWIFLIPMASFCLLWKQFAPEAAGDSSLLPIEYKDYNLLLITLDTLRLDHLHCYGYFRQTSPNIDALARKSVFFENAFIQLPITLPSHASILTGLYPQNTGVYRNYGRLDEKIDTLAEILKNQGYRTGAVASVAFLNKKSGIQQGFDDFYYNWDTSKTEGTWGGWEVQGPADRANQVAFNWLQKYHQNKFFFWVHYYDIHPSYQEQKGFTEIFDPASKGFNDYILERWDNTISEKQKLNITNYDREIRFTDHHLGRLIKFLEKLDVLKKTIVVIISDHGEGLYQHHGYVSHGKYLYDEQIRVPLIILLPGLEKQVRVKEIVQSVDILPTIGDLLSLDFTCPEDGRSLLPVIRSPEIISGRPSYALRKLEEEDKKSLVPWFSVRTLKYKLIAGEKGAVSLYDLDSDPYEMKNLAGEKDKKLREVEDRLIKDARGNFPLNPNQKNPAAPVDPETIKTLKSLGYLQ